MLNQLSYFRAKHKVESRHQIWQEGSHPQEIGNDEMMSQKLDYIHDNPVKRGLVAGPEHWRYSSAHERLPGIVPVLKCDPWQ
jgi:putative transposase